MNGTHNINWFLFTMEHKWHLQYNLVSNLVEKELDEDFKMYLLVILGYVTEEL